MTAAQQASFYCHSCGGTDHDDLAHGDEPVYVDAQPAAQQDVAVPTDRCVCSHVHGHHTRARYVSLTSMVRGPDGCAWDGCGCPRFLAALRDPA